MSKIYNRFWRKFHADFKQIAHVRHLRLINREVISTYGSLNDDYCYRPETSTYIHIDLEESIEYAEFVTKKQLRDDIMDYLTDDQPFFRNGTSFHYSFDDEIEKTDSIRLKRYKKAMYLIKTSLDLNDDVFFDVDW